MKLQILPLLFATAICLDSAQAVERLVNNVSSFNTSEPTNADIPNWETGWGAPAGSGITGWDYIGQVNGASGTYLRNGWVLTAGHVGAGNFTLGGTTYTLDSGSQRNIGTADLTLFHLTTSPANLPELIIATSPPIPFSSANNGSKVAMIGYGGGQGETWGYNTVTTINQPVTFGTFVSTDFVTQFGTGTAGSRSFDNQYRLVGGDSGGGDFIYNGTRWELAGNNEAVDSATMRTSFMVQLSNYKAVIDPITAVPEPSSWLLIGLGIIFVAGVARKSVRTT